MWVGWCVKELYCVRPLCLAVVKCFYVITATSLMHHFPFWVWMGVKLKQLWVCTGSAGLTGSLLFLCCHLIGAELLWCVSGVPVHTYLGILNDTLHTQTNMHLMFCWSGWTCGYAAQHRESWCLWLSSISWLWGDWQEHDLENVCSRSTMQFPCVVFCVSAHSNYFKNLSSFPMFLHQKQPLNAKSFVLI